MLLSIITVNFNNSKLTEDLLSSISNTEHLQSQIIVVDNASTENPVPAWQKKYPHIEFIRSEVNLGFAGGNNLGISKATGEFLFLVNNDTEFTPGLANQLINTLNSNDRIGVVSPKIHYWDNKEIIQYAGYTPMNYFTARNRCIGIKEKDLGQYNGKTGRTAYGHGAAMMIKASVIDKAGLMPENFFLYFEEFDWFERIKKSGYEIWVCMEAVIYHKESMSVGKNSSLKEYFMNRNRILFIRKNCNQITVIIFYLYFILIVAPRNILKYIISRNFLFVSLLFKAIFWNFNNNIDSQNKY